MIRLPDPYDATLFLKATHIYKQLSWIEHLWRELKDVMEVRPIYHHQKKDNVKGHIFASFLALYLGATLRRRLDTLRRQEHPDEAREGGSVEPPRLPIRWEKLLEASPKCAPSGSS